MTGSPRRSCPTTCDACAPELAVHLHALALSGQHRCTCHASVVHWQLADGKILPVLLLVLVTTGDSCRGDSARVPHPHVQVYVLGLDGLPQILINSLPMSPNGVALSPDGTIL